MSKRIVICLFVLIGQALNAQIINVSGKVTNQTGKPMSNAIVTLVQRGLKDTTGTDGSFLITGPNVGVLKPLLPKHENIAMNNGVLELTLRENSLVKVEIFNVKGDILKKVVLSNISAGIYHLNIADQNSAANLLIIKASIGSNAMTFRYNPFLKGRSVVNSSAENFSQADGVLEKMTANIDSIRITANGYMTKVVVLTSYNAVINIVLDSLNGNAGRSTGCGKPLASLKSGTYKITSSNTQREYIIDIPANYDPNHPYRLIFGFHWRGGSDVDVATGRTVTPGVWSYYGLKNIADSVKDYCIFVAPNGINSGWSNSNGQDLTFVDDMLKLIKGELCIDTTRIFSCGFSFGGGMTYALACARANVFRAVAIYDGGVLSGCNGGTLPIAYLQSHGVRDGVLSISGARSMRDRFVKNNGCTAQNPLEPAAGSQTHIVTDYKGCKTGYPIEWIAFDGGHDASPCDGSCINAKADTKGRQTYLPKYTWKFFTQF
jgi:poly(3-hydroxybutyrate) depolymerase